MTLQAAYREFDRKLAAWNDSLRRSVLDGPPPPLRLGEELDKVAAAKTGLRRLWQVGPESWRAARRTAASIAIGGGTKYHLVWSAPWVPHCDSPVRIERVERGYPGQRPVGYEMWVPCRRCQKCLQIKSFLWSDRAQLEIALSPRTWMVTLTFAPHHLAGILIEARKLTDDWCDPRQKVKAIERAAYAHVARYFKRVRKRTGLRFRYMATAEYGEESGRLHYHVLVHELEGPLTQRVLDACWRSHTHVRLVRDGYRAARYVAKYLTKDAASRMRASLFYGTVTARLRSLGRPWADLRKKPHATAALSKEEPRFEVCHLQDHPETKGGVVFETPPKGAVSGSDIPTRQAAQPCQHEPPDPGERERASDQDRWSCIRAWEEAFRRFTHEKTVRARTGLRR